MKNKKLVLVTRTAVLLALTVVFQIGGRAVPLGPNSNFVVGPLVNAALIVSVMVTGIPGGAIISIAAPYFAALTSNTPMTPFILVFSPYIAAGNFILILFVYLFKNKSYIYGLISGAILKFAVLYGGVNLMMNIRNVPAPQQKVLTFMFGWPQLATAIGGGIIAYFVVNALKKAKQL